MRWLPHALRSRLRVTRYSYGISHGYSTAVAVQASRSRLRVESYSYGYAYAVAPPCIALPGRLPAIPAAVLVAVPTTPAEMSFLCDSGQGPSIEQSIPESE